MSQVSLFTPVAYGPFVKSLPQTLLEIADNYFGGKKVQVQPGYIQGVSEGVIDCRQQISERTTFITRLLYAASVVPFIFLAVKKMSFKTSALLSLAVPALMLIGKIVLRSMYRFHRVEENTTIKFVGVDPSVYIHHPEGTLEYDKLYQLTYEEMAKLCIIPFRSDPLNHNLPLTSNKFYSMPPCIHKGISDLQEYDDSIFEYRCVDTYYEVVRRRSEDDENPLDFEGEVELTRDQMINLRIIPIPNSQTQGYAFSRNYGGIFVFQRIDEKYRVNRVERTGDYPFISFIWPYHIQYSTESLKLESAGPDYETASGQKWGVYHSKHAEFAHSCFLVNKIGDHFDVVRMLKP